MSMGALATRMPLAATFSGIAGAVARRPTATQLARFVAVGALSTAVNAATFLVLRTWLGPVPANLLALVLSTAVSTEANRRFTFGGVTARRWRAHLQIGGTVGFYAGYTSGVLMLVHTVVAAPTPLLESGAVVAASVLGGALRFAILRCWVFHPDGTAPTGRFSGCAGPHRVARCAP